MWVFPFLLFVFRNGPHDLPSPSAYSVQLFSRNNDSLNASSVMCEGGTHISHRFERLGVDPIPGPLDGEGHDLCACVEYEFP
jgi:hypothetical protein